MSQAQEPLESPPDQSKKRKHRRRLTDSHFALIEESRKYAIDTHDDWIDASPSQPLTEQELRLTRAHTLLNQAYTSAKKHHAREASGFLNRARDQLEQEASAAYLQEQSAPIDYRAWKASLFEHADCIEDVIYVHDGEKPLRPILPCKVWCCPVEPIAIESEDSKQDAVPMKQPSSCC